MRGLVRVDHHWRVPYSKQARAEASPKLQARWTCIDRSPIVCPSSPINGKCRRMGAKHSSFPSWTTQMPLSLLGVIKRGHWLWLDRSCRRKGTESCRSMSRTFIWVSDSEQDVCSTLYRLFGLVWFIWLDKFSFQVLVGLVGSLFAYMLSLCGRCGFGLFASHCFVFFLMSVWACWVYTYVGVGGYSAGWGGVVFTERVPAEPTSLTFAFQNHH